MINKRDDTTNINDMGIVMLLYGAPGVGKTTLACSADNAIVIDTDKGIKRVAVAHRADYSSAKTFKEIREDIASAKGQYDTIVVDTAYGVLDAMTLSIIAENPKMSQADGTLTLKAYGVLKNMFLAFSAELRASFKNVIFVCHEYASRDGDNQFFDIVLAGSTKQLIWQPIDLGARLFIRDGKRYLGFTPQDTYNAKSSFGIKGLIEIPELNPGEKNNFLSLLFAKARSNIKAEAASLAPQQEAYQKALVAGKEIIGALTKPEEVTAVLEGITGLTHALTSEKELKALLKARMAELNIVYEKSSKTYKFGESKK